MIDEAALQEAIKRARAFVEDGDVHYSALSLKCSVKLLLAGLAEPRLPAELSDELVEAIWWACDGHKHREVAEKIVDAIRSHLTKPPTKEVEVWRVEFTEHGRPACWTSLSVEEAHSHAITARNNNKQCVHVTGPHKQVIPA